MAKITYRSYTTPSHLYSPNSVIWKREDGRYIVAGLQRKEEAEYIRKVLTEIIRDYGNATVMDLYDLVGSGRGQYTHTKIGWNAMADLRWGSDIAWDKYKDWFIVLPETNWDSSQRIEIMPSIEQTPTSINITINTETIDDFDNVFAKVSQYANTITDRAVYISVI